MIDVIVWGCGDRLMVNLLLALLNKCGLTELLGAHFSDVNNYTGVFTFRENEIFLLIT
jgi:hypothetical protein